jgi:hypothetical protein
MNQSVRSEILDRNVQQAIENGYQKIDTRPGSGYLLLNRGPRGPKNLVAYELDILLNPETKVAAAVGSMVGDRDLLKRAQSCDDVRLEYSPGLTAEIQILHAEGRTAYFKALSRIGI